MRDPQFQALKLALLEGGIAPRYVQRTLLELQDHCADLESAAIEAGLSAGEARIEALASLGTEADLAACVLARTELRIWSRRWPRAAWATRAAVMLFALPLLPVYYCVDRGPVIARWSASASLALLLTGGFLLTMHWLMIVP
jgi:hypothetical protein